MTISLLSNRLLNTPFGSHSTGDNTRGGRGDGYGVMEPSNVDRVSRRASLLRVVPVRTAGGTVISHCPVLVVGPTILHDDTTDF